MANGTTRQLNITPEEIQSGKTFAIIAYFIFFVPLLIEEQRKNKFVMFHTEQATILALFNIGLWIINNLVIYNAFGYYGIWIFVGIGFTILHIATWVFRIMGIIAGAQGKYDKLPVIGDFAEKLNFVK